MGADFQDAHGRHWEDAESLFESERFANADHLYGLAAECGLKALMVAWGMGYNYAHDKPSDPSDRQHANGIWQRYGQYLQGPQASDYQLSTNPFNDWRIEQRYWPRSCIERDTVNRHRHGAEEVREVVQQARRDGWL